MLGEQPLAVGRRLRRVRRHSRRRRLLLLLLGRRLGGAPVGGKLPQQLGVRQHGPAPS